MNYRKWSIRAILLILSIISIVYAVKYKQWEYAKEILTRFIDYENGGLPKALLKVVI